MRFDRSRKSRSAKLVAGILAAVALSVAAPAAADTYNTKRSGHPLRILAYIVHPVGVILDTLIFRPFHWIGSQEYVRTLVGHEDE